MQSLPQTACIEPLSAALPCWNSTLASTYQGQKPSEGMTGWESMKPFTRFGGTFICWARPAHSGPSSWLSAAVAGAAAMASTAKGTGAEVDQAGWMDGRSGGSRLRKALAGTGGGGRGGGHKRRGQRGYPYACRPVVHETGSFERVEVRLQAARALRGSTARALGPHPLLQPERTPWCVPWRCDATQTPQGRAA